jgi:hypothetical protein
MPAVLRGNAVRPDAVVQVTAALLCALPQSSVRRGSFVGGAGLCGADAGAQDTTTVGSVAIRCASSDFEMTNRIIPLEAWNAAVLRNGLLRGQIHFSRQSKVTVRRRDSAVLGLGRWTQVDRLGSATVRSFRGGTRPLGVGTKTMSGDGGNWGASRAGKHFPALSARQVLLRLAGT